MCPVQVPNSHQITDTFGGERLNLNIVKNVTMMRVLLGRILIILSDLMVMVSDGLRMLISTWIEAQIFQYTGHQMENGTSKTIHLYNGVYQVISLCQVIIKAGPSQYIVPQMASGM